MKIGIMQPYFFPYIGYFQLINAVDKFIIYENLNYIVDGWMHKNRILIKKDEISYIKIHIMGKSSNSKISETKLVKDYYWKRKILNTVKQNYCGASNYADFFPFFEKMIKADFDDIHNYNSNIIINICEYLEIGTNIQFDNRNYLPLEKGLDAKYKEKKTQNYVDADMNKKTARVIEICKKEGAYSFINAIGGEKLYIKEKFRRFGIDLSFIQTGNIEYKQFNDCFSPNLSIIDVIMHCGREQTKNLLNEFSLV